MGSTPFAIVVMGVTGCGKSTVGTLLARRLSRPFAEGDQFHPPANVAKMRSGTPLNDEDRWPWLDTLAAWIDEHRAAGEPCVVACSALRRAYRERLSRGRDDVLFVFLDGSPETIAERLAARRHEYMPATLLASQFATLERPSPDEAAITAPINSSASEIVDAVLARLGTGEGRA